MRGPFDSLRSLRAVPVRTILVTVLAVALLAVFVRQANLDRVWAGLRAAEPTWLLAALSLTALMYIVRAVRWQCLLAPVGPATFALAFRTTVIGFAASFLLPARAGEVLRPYLLARETGLPFPATVATVIVERLLDLITVLLLLAGFLFFFGTGEAAAAPQLYAAVFTGALVVAPVGVLLLLAMFLLADRPLRVRALTRLLHRLIPTRFAAIAERLLTTFVDGLTVVRRPTRLLLALSWSLLLWLAIALQVWVITNAFHLTVPLAGSVLLTALLVVGVAVPTPGGVGGTHEALRLGLTAFYRVDNDTAVAAAIIQHAVNFVPVLLLGGLLLLRAGFGIRNLQRLSRTALAPPPASRQEVTS